MADGENFDIVIVGSGIAGALAAYKLSSRPYKILILEAGGWAPDRQTLYEIYVRNSAKGQDSPFSEVFCAPEPRLSAFPPGTNYYTYPYDVNMKDRSNFLGSFYQRLVGGATWHWQGISLRMVPDDFVMKTKYGDQIGAKFGKDRVFDWLEGCRYDDLESWYAAAEQEIGVAGDHDRDPFKADRKGKRFPMGAIAQSYQDKQYEKALSGTNGKFQGLDIRVTPVPQAKNSEWRDGRPACDGRATCIPLCPTKARYEAVFHVEKAMRSKQVEVRSHCVVTKLEVNDQNLVSRVKYRRWDGTEGSVSGRIVILAANAIEIPMILLQSPKPQGGTVANSSGAVGKYLMDHPIRMSYALAKNRMFAYRGPIVTSGIETTRDGSFRSERACFRTSILNDGWNWPSLAPLGFVGKKSDGSPDYRVGSLLNFVQQQKLFGHALRQKVADEMTRHTGLASAAEMLASEDNFVVPSATKLDRFDQKRPEIHFKVDQYAADGLKFALDMHKHIYAGLGVDSHVIDDRYFGSGHLMGTTMMGKVVDRDCRSYDHRNLFILGSSVFPAVSASNPTLTIAALALRAGELIKSELG